jgi:hypothetical protein
MNRFTFKKFGLAKDHHLPAINYLRDQQKVLELALKNLEILKAKSMRMEK